MKKDIFRSADFWKSAVMTMPDNSFFELLRSVFGKIKTPFNKQQLLNNLETFLLREDIQKTITSYIDQTDAKIIAAAAFFGEPFPEQLYNFFSGEFSYAQMQSIIVNLEERFILYRFSEGKSGSFRQNSRLSGNIPADNQQTRSRLALNPVLKSVLLPFTSDISALFPKPGRKKNNETQTKKNPVIINDLTLAAFFSFVSRLDSFYKTDAGGNIKSTGRIIRKRVVDEGKILFPGINLENISGALQILGLFYDDENKLIPDKKYFGEFGLLSLHERMEYCAAALLVYNQTFNVITKDVNPANERMSHSAGKYISPLEISPPLFRNRIRETVNFIHSFLDSLKKDYQYPVKTIKRMIEILKAKNNIEINFEKLIEILEKTGLIIKISAELFQSCKTADNGRNKDRPVIVINSSSSVIVYPEIDFSDAVKLASVSNIGYSKENGIYGNSVVHFELDRESAVRAFDNNINADDIQELLERLSCGNVNDTLIWNLKDWEKQYKDVSLKKGIVLQLAENRRYLTETKPLAGLIMETLAPGLYLLNENAMDDAADALQKAGIDIIARRKEKKSITFPAGNYFPTPFSLPVIFEETETIPKKYFTKNTLAEFHNALDKMPLGDAEKTELSARINRRLVLCEMQLKDADIRYEKLEARHMDYIGKQNIAKLAITQKLLVEIVYPEKGKDKTIIGIPQTLDRDENELILAVKILSVSDHADETSEEIRIPLAKISLLRRIKKSIFEI